MSDIKLFRIDNLGVSELPGSAATLEKSLQKLIEEKLDKLLVVRFLATEHSTGKQCA